MIGGWRKPDTFEEGQKRGPPLFTDADPAAPVVFPSLDARVLTPPDHGGPRLKLLRPLSASGMAMNESPGLSHFSLQAPTGTRVPTQQVRRDHTAGLPTVTPTEPGGVLPVIRRPLKGMPPAEHLTSEILQSELASRCHIG